jgi:anti-anti-sigma factor
MSPLRRCCRPRSASGATRSRSARREIDLATAPDLTALVDATAGWGRNRLVLDLADVEFMDVTGLNLIAGLAGRLRAAGGELVVGSLRS